MKRVALFVGVWFALTASTCSTSKPVVSPAVHGEARDEAIHLGAIGASCVVTLQQNDVTVATQTADATGTVNLVVTMRYDAAGNPEPGTLNLHATANCPTDAQPEQPWDVRWVAAVHGNQDVCAGGASCGPNQGIVVAGLTPPAKPIHLDGTTLRFDDGGLYWYQAVTAFDLLARSDDDRDAFLLWASTTGFTAVRVLTMASITANLPPSQGEAALPGLFDRLRRLHLGAELVLLADSGSYTDPSTDHPAYNLTDDQIRAHVRTVAQIVHDSGADLPLVFELANENAHPSQAKSLQDVAFLQELRGIVKSILPTAVVSLGSTCCGQADTVPAYGLGGDDTTLHLDRSRTPFWDEVRRVKDLIDTQNANRQLVLDDEPMGAAEADEPGKRSTNPTRFFVQGVLDRFGDLGGTFHCTDCIAATVPGPIQQACATAYIDGATIATDGALFAFANDSTGQAATHGADWSHVEKVFTFTNTTGGPSYLVLLNVTGDPGLTWANGWHAVDTVPTAYSGIQILEIAR